MAKSSRLSDTDGTTAEKPSKAVKKPVPLGTDRALSLPTAKKKNLHLTYWDLWFALVAASDFDGDLLRLARHLASDRSSYLFSRDSVDRKQNHLLDLGRRLTLAGVTINQIVVAAGDLVRTEKTRADKFVLKQPLRQREWSEAMHHTPRERRQQLALRGSWPSFPVSPGPFAEEIWSKFKRTGFYSENASFGVAHKLDQFTERANKLLLKGRYAEAQALVRALITVIVELIEMADDSCGCIGDSFGEGFKVYLKIPLAETGIEDSIFFADLLDFLIWEDYGFTWRQTDGYFRKLTREQADFCIAYLRRQIEELSAELLSYQSDKALTLLGQIVGEKERFDQFESLAREMGSRAWERIVKLADHAMKKRNRELACKVFEAALTEGDHTRFLQKKYDQLKMGQWNPDPRK